MGKVNNYYAATLRDKPRVVTRAVFWSVPHDTKRDDICLKIGRYNKPRLFDEKNVPETLDPKSELTLDDEELRALITLLQERYEPFRQGAKAFIPLERPFGTESAEQIRKLFELPQKKELVEFILNNDVIPHDLEVALKTARRVAAVRQYEDMLGKDLNERDHWQKWFEDNSWVLGTEYVRVLDERRIDAANISDFLMEAYDGFLDIVEIKRPEGGLRFWEPKLDHGNHVPHSDLTKAITQSMAYIFEVEREANSLKFLERVSNTRTVKPRCTLIFGRSHEWTASERQAYRLLNVGYHSLTILTYDHVLERAKRIAGMPCEPLGT
jgi:hypothetical protein